MHPDVLLSVNFNEVGKIIQVFEGMSFPQVVAQIQGTWPDLKDSISVLRFSVGSIKNCCLDSEEDFMNLLTLCQHMGEKIAFVNVNLVSGSSSRISPEKDQNSRSSNPNTSVNSDASIIRSSNEKDQNSPQDDVVAQPESSHMGSIPRYEMCPNEAPKSYLSDKWVDIFKDGVGSRFEGGAAEFRKELIKYSTRLGFNFRYIRNEKMYVHAVCDCPNNHDCNWYIKAKQVGLKPNFVVYKAHLNHSCMGTLIVQNNGRLGSRIIGDLVTQKVMAKPDICAKDVATSFHQDYGLEITYMKAWRSVEHAREHIFGSYTESYDQLRWYCEAIRRTNPGSIVDLEKNCETNQFERLFVAFKACINGFRTCRPMLFIDGTFMKGRAKGTLLSATAKDGDNGLYPVAFAIVGAENTDNWKWFLSKIKDGVAHEKQIFYISDRNTGLMAAFPQVFDVPVHFFCMYHLMNNLKGKLPRQADLVDLFRDCCYAPNKHVFQQKLQIFKDAGGEKAAEWIDGLPFDKWAVSYAPHIQRYGEMTSNAAESFNNWIREDRALPITYMIDSIRKKICHWGSERRDESAKWTGALCPKKEHEWNKMSNIGRNWQVQKYPNGQFEVASLVTACVDLKLKVCTCYQWQLQGFPCAHAVAVIRRYCSTIYGHIDPSFLAASYRECYKEGINPIPHTEKYECEATNEEDKVSPPLLNRPAGRPKKKRITSFGEFPRKKPFSCNRCNEKGRHDIHTCAVPPNEPNCGLPS